MASIKIWNLDEGIERQLRLRAADHGRSMEEEVRHILSQAVGQAPAPANLGESIHRRFASLGGVDLDLPPREAMSGAPRFDLHFVDGQAADTTGAADGSDRRHQPSAGR